MTSTILTYIKTHFTIPNISKYPIIMGDPHVTIGFNLNSYCDDLDELGHPNLTQENLQFVKEPMDWLKGIPTENHPFYHENL